MATRPAEKMDSLDVQIAESTVGPHLIDALEEPIIVMSDQFCYHAGIGVCLSHCVCLRRLIIWSMVHVASRYGHSFK